MEWKTPEESKQALLEKRGKHYPKLQEILHSDWHESFMARQLAQSVEEYFNITRTMTSVELLEAFVMHRVRLYMEEKMK